MSLDLSSAILDTSLYNRSCLAREKDDRGQRTNESQKAVIIDMMKSVGEIASEI